MQIESGWVAMSVFPFCDYVIRNTNTVVQCLLADAFLDPQRFKLLNQFFIEKCSQN